MQNTLELGSDKQEIIEKTHEEKQFNNSKKHDKQKILKN